MDCWLTHRVTEVLMKSCNGNQHGTGARIGRSCAKKAFIHPWAALSHSASSLGGSPRKYVKGQDSGQPVRLRYTFDFFRFISSLRSDRNDSEVSSNSLLEHTLIQVT
jgi:hypothetical protein